MDFQSFKMLSLFIAVTLISASISFLPEASGHTLNQRSESIRKHEFYFAMTNEGCVGAAKRALGKIGVDEGKIEADIPNNKLYVTSDKSVDVLLEALKKTGKEVYHVGSS